MQFQEKTVEIEVPLQPVKESYTLKLNDSPDFNMILKTNSFPSSQGNKHPDIDPFIEPEKWWLYMESQCLNWIRQRTLDRLDKKIDFIISSLSLPMDKTTYCNQETLYATSSTVASCLQAWTPSDAAGFHESYAILDCIERANEELYDIESCMRNVESQLKIHRSDANEAIVQENINSCLSTMYKMQRNRERKMEHNLECEKEIHNSSYEIIQVLIDYQFIVISEFTKKLDARKDSYEHYASMLQPFSDREYFTEFQKKRMWIMFVEEILDFLSKQDIHVPSEKIEILKSLSMEEKEEGISLFETVIMKSDEQFSEYQLRIDELKYYCCFLDEIDHETKLQIEEDIYDLYDCIDMSYQCPIIINECLEKLNTFKLKEQKSTEEFNQQLSFNLLPWSILQQEIVQSLRRLLRQVHGLLFDHISKYLILFEQCRKERIQRKIQAEYHSDNEYEVLKQWLSTCEKQIIHCEQSTSQSNLLSLISKWKSFHDQSVSQRTKISKMNIFEHGFQYLGKMWTPLYNYHYVN